MSPNNRSNMQLRGIGRIFEMGGGGKLKISELKTLTMKIPIPGLDWLCWEFPTAVTRSAFLKCGDCKVALATLSDTNPRWRIHCSGPDFTRIIYAVWKFHGVMRTWSCVPGVCACRKACRLARISCHVGRVPKWRLKGTGKLLSGFLCCVEVSHNLDLLDVLYRGVRVDCNL